MRTTGPAFILATACALAVTRAASGQARAAAGIDLGMSHVRYDDFLPSLAAFTAADASLYVGRTDLTARGAAVRYESGHHAFQGALGASHLTPGRGRTRVELSASGGASWYADFARFAHALGRARLHRAARGRGAWLGLTVGTTSYGDGWRPVAKYAAGGWRRAGPAILDASLTASTVGDTAYTDLEATLRLPLRWLTLGVWTGARIWSRGAGQGVYGEATITIPVHQRLGLIVSGGRYPTDPVRGTIAGRYVSAGVRLSGIAMARPAPPPSAPARPHHGSNGEFSPPVPGVEVWPSAGGPTLRVHAAGARTVEIIGDVTDWLPVPLTAAGADRWELPRPLPPGVRRLAIRVDGGPWLAPANTRRLFDEFGAEVGLLVVP